jgi:hypothetical protein
MTMPDGSGHESNEDAKAYLQTFLVKLGLMLNKAPDEIAAPGGTFVTTRLNGETTLEQLVLFLKAVPKGTTLHVAGTFTVTVPRVYGRSGFRGLQSMASMLTALLVAVIGVILVYDWYHQPVPVPLFGP